MREEEVIERLERVNEKLMERNEELESEYEKLDAYCELLMDALEDACEHMPLNEVAKLRLRHKKAMEVIS